SNNNVHTCRIVRLDGQDVSYNYDISYEYGTLTIEKRNVCLTVVITGEGISYSSISYAYSKTFDGTFATLGYAAEHLTNGKPDWLAAFIGGDGDAYDPAFSTIGLNGGELPNCGAYAISIVMPSEDWCENYAFTLESRRLLIEPRQITVWTGTKSLAYNGTAQSWQEYTIDNRPDGQSALLAGHELRLTTLFERTDAGVYENENKYEVIGEGAYGAFGNPDRSNYQIIYGFGKLTITQATLRIKPTLSASSMLYGGNAVNPVAGYEILSGALFGSDTLDLRTMYTGTLVSGAVVTTYGGVTDAGFYAVGYDPAYADENNPNYEITFETVDFTILQRSITLATASDARDYDGTELTAPRASVGGDGLADGDALEAIAETITAVIDYTPVPVANETEFAVMHGERDVTHNYIISYGTSGTLRIDKRNITITPEGSVWEYDGDTHTKPSAIGDGLASTDSLVAIEGTITETGTEPNGEGIENETKFDIYRGTALVSDNYIISYQTGGKLIITKRKVTIRPAVASVVYDGNVYAYTFNATRDVKSGSFLPGDAERVTLTYSMSGTLYNGTKVENAQLVTDAAAYAVSLDTCTLGERDKYYDITCETGAFEIKRRELAVRPADLERTYDGTFTEIRHGADDYEVVSFRDGLASGHMFRILGTTDVWNVSEGVKTKRGIQITAGTVLDPTNADVTYNYIVYTQYEDDFGYDLFKSDFNGKITVTQIEITVKPLAPKDGDGNKTDYFYQGDSQAVLPDTSGD
ncbi:MAG: hypothetical protein K2M95_08235, partial [Clostridiales bacterium]|nr:hypothetical protein [Clostridiales bacterium]